jgi:hypothetical protein
MELRSPNLTLLLLYEYIYIKHWKNNPGNKICIIMLIVERLDQGYVNLKCLRLKRHYPKLTIFPDCGKACVGQSDRSCAEGYRSIFCLL